jgi:hypothetical protein
MIALALFMILVGGCTEAIPTAPLAAGTPPVDTSTRAPTVQGTVFETMPEGRRPVPGAYLNVLSHATGSGYGITAYADTEGRYTISTLPNGSTVLVHAMGGLDGAGFHRHQPCVATAVVKGDTVLDVEFNHKDVRGSGGSPTVSGVVFETTATGRQPVRERQVLYYAPNILAAHTITDANGRYEFCKVPLGVGKVFVTDPYDWDLGGPAAEHVVNVVGDVVVDLEISR